MRKLKMNHLPMMSSHQNHQKVLMKILNILRKDELSKYITFKDEEIQIPKSMKSKYFNKLN